MSLIDETIKNWNARKASLRCGDVIDGLEALKFVVKSVGTAGHKTYSHPNLADFYGGSFDCGHLKNQIIKPSYIVKILGVLRARRDELVAIEQGDAT